MKRVSTCACRWRAAVLASFLAVAAPWCAPGASGSPLAGNRVLVVAPENARIEAQALAELLTQISALDTQVSSTQAYATLIDERYYDGFVYLGTRYDRPPKRGFLDDMARTDKPLLWIGYHAWLLDKPVLGQNGIRIRHRHSQIYDAVVAQVLAPLPETDTTDVQAPAEHVLAWLYDPSRLSTLPGVVHVPGFTYVSYFPSLEAKAPDFPAFRRAVAAAFGHDAPSASSATPYVRRVEAARADPFWGGVHLPVYVSGSAGKAAGYGSDRVHDNLVRIREAGGEWVTISQIHYQEGIRASRIHAHPELTPRFESIANVVEDAHKLGLRVRLSPIVNLTEASRGPGEWRGWIRADDLQAWWAAYRELILGAAVFAREHEIEALNIGAELSAMQRDEAQWRELVAAVRQVARYQGLVGYQVNFDAEALDSLVWGDALDYVGIAAYWPLAGDRDPKLQELLHSWEGIEKRLERWRARNSVQRLEFSEIGYASQPYASVLPYSWKPHRGADQSLEEQLTCYRALERFFDGNPPVSGVHFFASTEEDLDPNSVGYTPFGKPAENIVQRILKKN